MNVLLLTQVLPFPLDAGPKVRAYYMLRHLAARHAVTLVSFTQPDDRPEYVAPLRNGIEVGRFHVAAARTGRQLKLRLTLQNRPAPVERQSAQADFAMVAAT